MSVVSEIIQAIKSFEDEVKGFMFYDSMVGGLVSRSLNTLAESREILSQPTGVNYQEALKKIEGVRSDLSPYTGYVPAMATKINSIIEKLRTL
ncbi:MAG: hypothetical protein QG670_758 [Thermoproteota archaeon]|nr:hypothetical protein [Thermoproteota archaeon]